jgi:hypothetical protein
MTRSTGRRLTVADQDRAGEPMGAPLSRRRLCGGALALLGAAGTMLLAGCGEDEPSEEGSGDGAPGGGGSIDTATPVIYASPTCGCCQNYAPYLQENGYDVDVNLDEDLAEVKSSLGIPAEAEGCHTTTLDGYVIEGHVPVEAIDRLLRERPAVDAIALPGMPTGSPGMSGSKEGPFEILSVTDGAVSSYMSI